MNSKIAFGFNAEEGDALSSFLNDSPSKSLIEIDRYYPLNCVLKLQAFKTTITDQSLNFHK